MNRRGKTKEGFLHVKQPSRFGKAWKRKWVVIRPNATKGSEQSSVLLELYLEKGAYNKTVTSLLLEGITQIKRVLSKSQPRAFEFAKGSGVVALTLAGDSETETQEWIEIFKKLLLPASEQKELTSVLGYGTDVIRVSVVPNKDSERLKLSGTYLAGVSRLQVTLHNVITGEKVIEWDLRHMKRFMLPSKGPQQDLEKIACLQISNRSPQGEGEYLFYSPSAKPLVETIYERLSSAITVKERRSRTSSMLFEIPPKELEQLAKNIQEGGDPGFVMVSTDGSIEDETFEGESEKKENGEAKTNGDTADGEQEENHVGESTAEEVKLENGQDSQDKKENGQNEEVKTNEEVAAVQEAPSNEKPVDGEATEVVKENGVTSNGDDSPKDDAESKTQEAEDDAKVEGDGAVAVSQESSNDAAEETTHNEKPVEEVEGKVDNSKTTENEQPAESSPVSADESPSAAPVETQDFAAGPLDAEEDMDDVAGSAVEVQPRMPPGAEELQQESEATESEDACEKMDERTVAADNSTVSEQKSEEVEAAPQIDSSVEVNNQVEISTDTQDIDAESATVEETSAAGEQSATTSENKQEQSVPTEEMKASATSEEVSPESTKQPDESTDEGDVKTEPVHSDSANASETPATEDSSAAENTPKDQNDKVPDEGSTSVEESPSSPSEQVDNAPSNKTPTSDEVAQNDKPDPLAVESIEPPIQDEGSKGQEKVKLPSDDNAVTESDKADPSSVESVESPILNERITSQEKSEEEPGDKNADEEDTAM